jgi:GH24 family phage-related lysozyme (muramidase)
MYETFHSLEEQVKSDLPHLNPRQRWAVKSLAFNWGYGNVKRSGLWQHLKAGAKGKKVAAAWMRTQVATGNHRTSRRMEVALWNGDDAAVLKVGKNAYNALRVRGDFEHY